MNPAQILACQKNAGYHFSRDEEMTKTGSITKMGIAIKM